MTTPWTEHVPLDLVNRVVARLMNSGRDGIILANEVNTLLGYSARRRAERESGEREERRDLHEAQMERADLLIERDALAARLTTVEAERDLLRRQHQGQADHITALRTRVAQADARLAAVEALADQWDEKAAILSRQSESRAGLSDAEMLAAVSEFYAARSTNLRAALSAAPTDTTKEN